MRLLSPRSAIRLATTMALVVGTATAAQAQWSFQVFDDPVNTDDGRPYGALLCSGVTGSSTAIHVFDDADWTGLCPALIGDHGAATGPTHFGAHFTSFFDVFVAGPYAFDVMSDDGSSLFIDGAPELGIPGNHGLADDPGNVSLGVGSHQIDVYYYEWEGIHELGASIDPSLSGSPVSATPEPASIALLATGLFGLGGVARVRRKRSET